MRPSPARAEPHDSASWLPLPDVDALPELDDLIATSTGATEARSAPPGEAAPAPPSPARARPHDAATWFPLPVPDELPSIDEMLTQSPWDAKPSPARAEPHDASAWLPLPDVATLPDVGALIPEPSGPPPSEQAPARVAPAPRRRLGALARPRTVLIALLLAGTLVAGGLALQRLADGGNSVEVRADGRRISVDTGATTVGDLLRDQKVRVGANDRVVPTAGTRLRDGLTVTVLRGFPITRDLDGTIETVYTTYASPADYVRRDLKAADTLVMRSGPERLQADSTIILRTPHQGRLLVDGAEVDYDIPALDLKELLAQYSVDPGPEDYVLDRSGRAIGRDTVLVNGEQYSVVRVGREIVRVAEPYNVDPERRPDHTMAVGETRVEAAAPGVLSVSYEITRRNGEDVERKTISKVPTTVAKPMITYYGTKADPMWDRIAECETGGNWGMQGPLYSGGLGFYNNTWDAFGGRDFASNAGLASREEQIIVAERVRSGVGITGWGCAHILGYVR
ncbi:MAG: transglycosylase family protein [Acidimicrobiia bacterium]